MTAADLNNYFEDIVKSNNVPGLAITVVKDNSIVYQDAFGYANLENKVAYTNQTVSSIASISKTFVGAAVVKAIEQGYFTMETHINDILPVAIVNPKRLQDSIKIKHLVTHTSGLLDDPTTYIATNYHILPGQNMATEGARLLMNELGIEQREAYALDEYLAEYFLEDGDLYDSNNFADTAVGSTWAYSNLATGLMGLVIEVATGKSFDDYVKENVLQPLQMNRSTYDISEVNLANMATLYVNDQTPLPMYANDSYPEGSIYTTNEDMGKYLLDMANGLKGASTALFSEAGYDSLFNAKLAAGKVPQDFAENQAMFWYLKDGKVMHGGNSFGISTHLEIAVDGNSGFLFLSNMDASFSGNYENFAKVKEKVANGVAQFLESNY
tara:strand:+ start:56089 stop:57237 length:1149 start_codon:yes stop_codon:yes gene_type:complete